MATRRRSRASSCAGPPVGASGSRSASGAMSASAARLTLCSSSPLLPLLLLLLLTRQPRRRRTGFRSTPRGALRAAGDVLATLPVLLLELPSPEGRRKTATEERISTRADLSVAAAGRLEPDLSSCRAAAGALAALARSAAASAAATAAASPREWIERISAARACMC